MDLLPFTIIFMEKILTIFKTYGWRLIRRVLPTVLALGIVFLFGGVLIEIAGESAFEIYRILWSSTFGSLDDFGYVLFNATPHRIGSCNRFQGRVV